MNLFEMEKIIKNLNKLKILSCCKKKIKDNLIKKGDREFLLAIEECVINTLNGNINLSKKEKSQLIKFKYSLRRLIREKSLKGKKKILIQQGGFLQVLLPSAITLISAILDNLKTT